MFLDGMAMQPAPNSANGIQYGPQEFEFYQQLYAIASPDGRDAIEPTVAANFLSASHLPQEILHQVWHFATSLQSYTQDYLTCEGFYLACRLIAWAQNGGVLDVVHAHQPPPLLPEFPGLQRPPSSLGSRAQSVRSDRSELQPAIQASDVVQKRSPRSFTQERWAPSRREKRKYASLFKRVDWDQVRCSLVFGRVSLKRRVEEDGFVHSNEAWSLLERSHLDQNTLQQIWDLSDATRCGL